MDQVRSKMRRVVLLTLIGLASLNLWTGGPLFALWVGSRTQGSGPPTMTGLFVVTIVLLAVTLGLIRLIAALQNAYNEHSGKTPSVRAHTPWLRSMRGERPLYSGQRAHLTAPERVLVLVVVVAVVVFEIWFFFFSGSPIDQRSGRADGPPSPVTTAIAKPSYPCRVGRHQQLADVAVDRRPSMLPHAGQGSITCSGFGCSEAGAAL